MKQLKLVLALAATAMLSVNVLAWNGWDDTHAVFLRVTDDAQLKGPHQVIFIANRVPDAVDNSYGDAFTATNGTSVTTSTTNNAASCSFSGGAIGDKIVKDITSSDNTYLRSRYVWITSGFPRTTLRPHYWHKDGGYFIANPTYLYNTSYAVYQRATLGTYRSYIHPFESDTAYIRTFEIPGAAAGPIKVLSTNLLQKTGISNLVDSIYVYQPAKTDPIMSKINHTDFETYVRVPAVIFSGGDMLNITNQATGSHDGTITLPSPTSVSYKQSSYSVYVDKSNFLGWSTVMNNKDSVVGGAGATFTYTKETTLYAVYAPVDGMHTIKFNVGDHGTCDTKAISTKIPFTMPAVTVEDGYYLRGWRSADGSQIIKPGVTYPNNGASVISGNETFTAVYDKVFEIIEWRPDAGASGVDTVIIKYPYDARSCYAEIWDPAGTKVTSQLTVMDETNTVSNPRVDSCIYRILLPSGTLSTGYSNVWPGMRLDLKFFSYTDSTTATSTIQSRRVNTASCVVPLMTGQSRAQTTDNSSYTITTAKNTSPYNMYLSRYYNANYENCDLVVGRNWILYVDASYTFRNVYVMPGARLVVCNGCRLTVTNDLVLRGGEVIGYKRLPTHTQNMRYKYRYPQLQLEGSVAYKNFYYEYILNQGRDFNYASPDYSCPMYPLVLPYRCCIADITYRDGTPADLDEHFYINFWDGQFRANNGDASKTDEAWNEVYNRGSGWRYFGTDTHAGGDSYIQANEGFTINLLPQEAAVYPRNYTRLRYGILRFPMIADLSDGEATANKAIAVSAFVKAGQDETFMGWNFIGNPYLANFGNVSTTDYRTMYGHKSSNTPIIIQNNGEYLKTLGYVIIPAEDGQSYSAEVASGKTLNTFSPFFVQIGQGDNLVFSLERNFAYAKPGFKRAPQYELDDPENDIRTGITLSLGDMTDHAGLLIGDGYTEDYEINYDLAKWMNAKLNVWLAVKNRNYSYLAVSGERAEQAIPVGFTAPAAGTYRFAFDAERNDIADIEALYLTDVVDNKTVNLLTEDYTFTLTKGGIKSASRFYLSVKRNTVTDLEDIATAADAYITAVENGLQVGNLPVDAKVNIIDMSGKLVLADDAAATLRTYTLPQGVYNVQVLSADKAQTLRAVVK